MCVVVLLKLKAKIELLPNEPGCYLMQDGQQEVVYVGKAKNLKKRVKSYFTGAHNEKTTRLLLEVADFSYILTNSESESLILENNLIKQYKPKYNIRLIDDKTYPYIEITQEKHPRLRIVRKKTVSGKVFGPYPNVYSARQTERLLNRIYPLRKCEKLPKKACLYYHMEQCLAPCIKDEIDYKDYISQIIKFLKGDQSELLTNLKMMMERASLTLEYEKAAEYRDMLSNIKTTTEKQIIDLNDRQERDIISFSANKDDVAIQILIMKQGKITDHHQVVYNYVGKALDSVVSYLQQYYESLTPKELLLSESFKLEDVRALFGKKAIIPKIGDKKKLVDLASKNAAYDLKHHFMLYRHQKEKTQKGLAELGEVIGQKVNHIEVFDNAQLFGTAPISALIVYKDGELDKNNYRRYHLKTTTNDDYQAMREVVYRRYHKSLMENSELPDLVLVDGGSGQVKVAQETLNSLDIKVAIAGLKKDKKHLLQALVYKGEVIPLTKQSEMYKLLVKLSAEVHRFATNFHKKTRKKQSMLSPLDKIKGLGEKRKKMLLNEFASLKDIYNASEEQLKGLGIPKNVIVQIRKDTYEKNNT